MFHIIETGDCREVMKGLRADSVPAVCTDPPYGLGFMGKGWDYEVPGPEYWREVLRVAVPGAHLLAFGGTKKYHRLTCAIEDAGWEIRDAFSWLYGQGMPKSDLLLKPAWEPVVLARKPGATGALNIDGCRIEVADQKGGAGYADGSMREVGRTPQGGIGFARAAGDPNDGKGRWPANVVLDEEAAQLLDAQTGVLTSGAWRGVVNAPRAEQAAKGAEAARVREDREADSGGASRFFYVAKASRAERTMQKTVENKHPTVKPIALMRWLIRLITPPGGWVLDPFCGSGSTGVAARLEGFGFVGIDKDSESVAVAQARCDRWETMKEAA